MTSLSVKYMGEMHQSLREDYRTPDGKNRAHCFSIAREMQKLLITEGKSSQIFYVRGALTKAEREDGDCIIPLQYQGRINDWRVHIVAVADKHVWDPMLGKPVPIEDYCSLAFKYKTEILPANIPIN